MKVNEYVDGRETGQHDVLNCFDGDGLMVIEGNVRQRVWAWCLAHNLAACAALCRAFTQGWNQNIHVRFGEQDKFWSPGCTLTSFPSPLAKGAEEERMGKRER